MSQKGLALWQRRQAKSQPSDALGHDAVARRQTFRALGQRPGAKRQTIGAKRQTAGAKRRTAGARGHGRRAAPVLVDNLERRVIGQHHGLATIARRIQTSRTRLDDPNAGDAWNESAFP
jgi:ATP-dependent Clp protease ATP-binding subunit ClpA